MAAQCVKVLARQARHEFTPRNSQKAAEVTHITAKVGGSPGNSWAWNYSSGHAEWQKYERSFLNRVEGEAQRQKAVPRLGRAHPHTK